MAGLLDFAQTPEGQGLLAAAFGGLAGAKRGAPINTLGIAGMSGLLGYGQAQGRAQDADRFAQEKKVRDAQLAQQAQQLEQQKMQKEWIAQQDPALRSSGGAMSNGQGPTLENAANIPQVDPREAEMYNMLKSGIMPVSEYVKSKGYGPKEYKTVGNDLVDVSGQAPRSVFTAAEKKTDLERQLDAAGITDPTTRQRYITAGIVKSTTHAPGANTNVVIKQEGEEAKTVGKGFGEAYNAINAADMQAAGKIARFDRFGKLVEGINTGKLTPAATEVSALAKSLGIDVDPKLGAKQAAAALSNEMALQLRNPSGGAGMPGAMSDADRNFLAAMTPNLGNDAEGNRLMIETAKKLAQRDRDVAKLARAYRTKNGTLNEGFYNELSAWSEQNPLFAAPAQAPGKPSSGGVKFLGFE